MADEQKENKRSSIMSLLRKALGQDEKPKPYKKEVTEEDIKKTEKIVKGISDKVK